MNDKVVFKTADGTVDERNTENEDIINLHINEDKNAVIVKYHDYREIIPLHCVYKVVEHNHHTG